MEVTSHAVSVHTPTDVAEARRVAVRLADQVQFDETDAGRVALVATEMATNLLKHASGGEMVVRVAAELDGGTGAVELLAIDRGPGMADVRACLEDGYSTAGSHGIGLGAVHRASAEFEVYSRRGRGSAVRSLIERSAGPRHVRGDAFTFGAVNVTLPGERECGDTWALASLPGRAVVMVADGLGHGPAAARAAARAKEVFLDQQARTPGEIVDLVHSALRSTRGAAVAVTELDLSASTVRHCGLGNVAAVMTGRGQSKQLVSLNGTAGYEGRRIKQFDYPWIEGAVLIVHSDGLQTRWQLEAYDGLEQASPGIIAAVLYRDHRRGRDDATVCVLRPGASRPAIGNAPGRWS